jgi:hypothetical protein
MKIIAYVYGKTGGLVNPYYTSKDVINLKTYPNDESKTKVIMS